MHSSNVIRADGLRLDGASQDGTQSSVAVQEVSKDEFLRGRGQILAQGEQTFAADIQGTPVGLEIVQTDTHPGDSSHPDRRTETYLTIRVGSGQAEPVCNAAAGEFAMCFDVHRNGNTLFVRAQTTQLRGGNSREYDNRTDHAYYRVDLASEG